MKEINNEDHLLVTELNSTKECNLKIIVEKEDILHDIKFLMSEYYVATFIAEGNGLKIAFNNGQSFKLTVAEI